MAKVCANLDVAIQRPLKGLWRLDKAVAQQALLFGPLSAKGEPAIAVGERFAGGQVVIVIGEVQTDPDGDLAQIAQTTRDPGRLPGARQCREQSPMRNVMIEITTSSSMSVKPIPRRRANAMPFTPWARPARGIRLRAAGRVLPLKW